MGLFSSAAVSVEGCRFRGSRGVRGGALAALIDTNLTVVDSSISGATASFEGGAVYSGAILYMRNVSVCPLGVLCATTPTRLPSVAFLVGVDSIQKNCHHPQVSDSGSAGDGGGLSVGGFFTLVDVSISRCSAGGSGGAIVMASNSNGDLVNVAIDRYVIWCQFVPFDFKRPVVNPMPVFPRCICT